MYFTDKLLYGFKTTFWTVLIMLILAIINYIIIFAGMGIIPINVVSGTTLLIIGYVFLFFLSIFSLYFNYKRGLNGKYRYLKNIHSKPYIFFRTSFVDATAVFYSGFIDTFSNTNKLEY